MNSRIAFTASLCLCMNVFAYLEQGGKKPFLAFHISSLHPSPEGGNMNVCVCVHGVCVVYMYSKLLLKKKDRYQHLCVAHFTCFCFQKGCFEPK